MQYLNLSPSLRMSRIVHGYWRAHEWGLDARGYLALIRQLLALGINTFDHAACYGGFDNERAFGEALALEPSLREQMVIVSKCGIAFPNARLPRMRTKHYDNTREHIIWSAERSVAELQCGYLDLLLIHRPSPCANPQEIAAAFDALLARGLVRHVGVSNYSPAKFSMLQSYLQHPLVTNQIEVSALRLAPFEDGSLDALLEKRVRPMAWSPLGGGRLFDPADPQARRVADALLAVGEPQGETRLDTLALAWLLAHPIGMIPIVGSGRIERVRAAVDALAIDFTEEAWLSVYVASQGFDLP
ncbi:MAG: aldo/keto reductase [Lautropia sp.]|nr:aldo/keto reductase [Lautropia sp.]